VENQPAMHCGERRITPKPARRGRGLLRHNGRWRRPHERHLRAAPRSGGSGSVWPNRDADEKHRHAMPHGENPSRAMPPGRRLRFLGNGHTGVDGFAHLARSMACRPGATSPGSRAIGQAHCGSETSIPDSSARATRSRLFQRPIEAVHPRAICAAVLAGRSRLMAFEQTAFEPNQHGREGDESHGGVAHDAPPAPPPPRRSAGERFVVQLFEGHWQVPHTAATDSTSALAPCCRARRAGGAKVALLSGRPNARWSGTRTKCCVGILYDAIFARRSGSASRFRGHSAIDREQAP